MQETTTQCIRRRTLKIATYNTLSLLTSRGYIGTTQLEELAQFCKNHQIAALALQEHSCIFKDSTEIKHSTVSNFHFISTSAVDVHGAPVGGIAWLMHSSLHANIKLTCKVSPRILHIGVQQDTEPLLHLVNIYAPTATHPTDRDSFFEELSTYLNDQCSTGLLFVAGDFNSLQQIDTNHPFGVRLNPQNTSKQVILAADQFTEFLHDSALITTNGQYKSTRNPYSFRRANTGGKVLIDHILTRSTLHHMILNTESFARPTVSDHWPICATFNIELRHQLQKSKPRAPKLNCTPLIADPETIKVFTAEVLARIPPNPVLADYDTVIEAFKIAAETHLQKIQHDTKIPYMDRQSVKEARSKLAESHEIPLHLLKQLFNNITGARHDGYAADGDAVCATFATLLHVDPHAAYQSLKTITRTYNPSGNVTGETVEQRLTSIAQTCKRQLSNTIGDPLLTYEPHTEMNETHYTTTPFTMKEFKAAVCTLQNYKTPGPDNIHPEFLKLPDLHAPILHLLNDMFENQRTHPRMRETAFAMIPKSGADLKDPAGWRYIALMSYISKLYDLLLRERIKAIIEPHLRMNQNGFRQHRNTQQHILAL